MYGCKYFSFICSVLIVFPKGLFGELEKENRINSHMNNIHVAWCKTAQPLLALMVQPFRTDYFDVYTPPQRKKWVLGLSTTAVNELTAFIFCVSVLSVCSVNNQPRLLTASSLSCYIPCFTSVHDVILTSLFCLYTTLLPDVVTFY